MKLKVFCDAMFSFAVLSMTSLTALATDLNICYVKSPFNLQNIVMKENRMLEKEFAGSDVKVIWHEINSGAKQAQALAAGALDVSAVMNTASLLLAVGVGNDLVIATGAAHPNRVFALVGKKGHNYSVKDLKGKTVAGPRGTVLHQMLVAALKKEGMTMQDIQFVSMDPPKAYAALVGNSVDAALLAAGLVVKAHDAGMKTITTAEGLVKPNLVMVARRAYAEEHPDLLKRVVAVHRKAHAWINENKEKALEMGAKAQGVSPEVAQKLFDWSSFYDVLTEDDIRGMQEDKRFLIENGLMRTKMRIDVRSLVMPEAMR